jgi:carboxylesterase type B
MLTTSFVTALISASILSVTSSQRLPGSPSVEIDTGRILGASVVLQSATVSKYLGIPFAKSPPERFSPPVRPEKWSVPLDASKYKPACIQQFNSEL